MDVITCTPRNCRGEINSLSNSLLSSAGAGGGNEGKVSVRRDSVSARGVGACAEDTFSSMCCSHISPSNPTPTRAAAPPRLPPLRISFFPPGPSSASIDEGSAAGFLVTGGQSCGNRSSLGEHFAK
ncbi:hypothetical protein M433DRAFT_379390 [Acidomyces richmondensis BFW]|nr:MAG: hypothetical protein FE78DRAFT_519238 [Acidomyces sp. 'richmondensis']KYG42948.1 hypothetical protein M433DRAFT_379390 [Acidomyces richmondensis BFW]